MTAALDNRPKASYRGDVTPAVGQMVGRTLAGEWLVVDEVSYSPDLDRSVVRFRYATSADVPPAAVGAVILGDAFVRDRVRFLSDQIRAGAR